MLNVRPIAAAPGLRCLTIVALLVCAAAATVPGLRAQQARSASAAPALAAPQPGNTGGENETGPYDVVANWPTPWSAAGYIWGSQPGILPGAWWELHQFSVDSGGNFYGADSFNGRSQKFRPRAGVDRSLLVGAMDGAAP